jgi:hypothetical protein
LITTVYKYNNTKSLVEAVLHAHPQPLSVEFSRGYFVTNIAEIRDKAVSIEAAMDRSYFLSRIAGLFRTITI